MRSSPPNFPNNLSIKIGLDINGCSIQILINKKILSSFKIAEVTKKCCSTLNTDLKWSMMTDRNIPSLIHLNCRKFLEKHLCCENLCMINVLKYKFCLYLKSLRRILEYRTKFGTDKYRNNFYIHIRSCVPNIALNNYRNTSYTALLQNPKSYLFQ